MDTIKSNQVVEITLQQGNQELAKLFDGDIVLLKAPMRQPIDDAVKVEIEEIQRMHKQSGKAPPRRLVVIIETTGGSIEVVERIANVFRQHYKIVEFVVPNYAYSAGTVLVMSGDEIHMDYYSILGPIDPQMPTENGYVPGMGYLAKFRELSDTINRSSDPEKVRAELAFLVNKFDPAMLFSVEQAIEHSKALLRDWLPKYKFKSWKKRETSGKSVTKADREKRADQIATVLGDAEKWHSHGRGISIRELESEDIKLKVSNYGNDEELYINIAQYYGLLVDYMARVDMKAGLHSSRGLMRLI